MPACCESFSFFFLIVVETGRRVVVEKKRAKGCHAGNENGKKKMS